MCVRGVLFKLDKALTHNVNFWCFLGAVPFAGKIVPFAGKMSR
jgi:hypothetical protein